MERTILRKKNGYQVKCFQVVKKISSFVEKLVKYAVLLTFNYSSRIFQLEIRDSGGVLKKILL